MRCSRCDMPLSPTKISCPRCGTAGVTLSNGPGFGNAPIDVAPSPQQWGQYARNVPEIPFASPIHPTTPSAPQPMGQGFSGDVSWQQQPITNEPLFLASSQPQGFQAASTVQKPQKLSFMSQQGNHSTGMGFGLAGLCTVIACLILIFVYFMAQNLPLPSSGLSSQLAAGPTPSTTHITPVSARSPTATSPMPSSTATYPGQQYIANAHTTNVVNTISGQPTLVVTTFRIGQKIYITFDVHPGGHVGAICLLWFINGTQFFNYPFALNTINNTSAYSYAAAGDAGSGYIEIYWESAPSCTDPNKILGDRVNFMVTV